MSSSKKYVRLEQEFEAKSTYVIEINNIYSKRHKKPGDPIRADRL